MMEDESVVEWRDGSIWIVAWESQFGCYFAQRWYPEDLGLEAIEGVERIDCPGPEEGLFQTLETLEVAMGEPIPDGIWATLRRREHSFPLRDPDKEGWGTVFACEVHRIGPDGEIVTSFAPPWADDPESPEWDLDDCCGHR